MQKLALEATQENISSTFQEDILKRNIDIAYNAITKEGDD